MRSAIQVFAKTLSEVRIDQYSMLKNDIERLERVMLDERALGLEQDISEAERLFFDDRLRSDLRDKLILCIAEAITGMYKGEFPEKVGEMEKLRVQFAQVIGFWK